jgi:hypothetical protein
MSTFQLNWILFAVMLIMLGIGIGLLAKLGIAGLLIDRRGRYSLTHLQIVLWTIIILSSLIAVFVATNFDPSSLRLSSQLLGLMGISAGSAVLSTAVKDNKDTSGKAIARAGMQVRNIANPTTTITIKPHFSQIWLEEEGDTADQVISITKYQNFIFTLVVIAFYIVAAWRLGGLPELPESIVWLIGISHAGYVGGKIPDKR